jgi:hypothetical protein
MDMTKNDKSGVFDDPALRMNVQRYLEWSVA